MIPYRFLSALVFLILIGCQEPPATSPLWGHLEPGPYDVGLRQLTFIESTRDDSQLDAQAERRPIEVVLWYPAMHNKEQSRLQFQDYVHLLPQFRETRQPDARYQWLSTGISGDANAVGRDTLDLILNAAMHASQSASPVSGEFPLVLWTMRHETLVAQSVLCEYVASHGYVVAAARYAGPALPMPWALETEEEKHATFATHLQDLTFALESLEQEPMIDASRVSVLTWSYAAEQAPRIQMDHANVKLVIGLSSNPLSPAGLYQGTQAATHLDADRLDVPYIIMTERLGFNGQERTPPAILTELPAESYFVRFDELSHGNFNTLEGMLPGVWEINTVQPWSRGGDVAQLGYETISRYVLTFLNHYLKAEAVPGDVERAWEAELPPGFVTVTRYGEDR